MQIHPPAPAPSAESAGPLAAYLAPGELARFHRVEPWRAGLRIAAEWALIAAAIAAWAATRHPVVLVLAILVVGTRQHALINLVHEAVHYNLSRDGRWNDWIGDVFCAAPVLLATSSHRAGHLPHHTHLGEAHRDTEARVWINIRGWRLANVLAQHALGITMVRAVLRYSPRAADGSRPSLGRYAGLVLATNAAIFAYCAALGVPFAWLYLWIYPLFSVALLLVSLLAIAQHQPVAYAALGRDDLDADLRPVLARDAIGSRLERFWFATVGAAYHHEHHLLPGVPHTQLPALHELLRSRGFYARRGGELRGTYVGTLRDLVRGAAAATTP